VSTVSASLRSRICFFWGRSSSVRRSGWRVSEPGTCRTVGATGTGGGAVRVSRNGCRYPTDGLVAPIAQRRDLCGEGGGVGVPALKRLQRVRDGDRYRARQREPGLPQARSTSATRVAAVANGMGQRATRSSQMAARAPPESAEA
jgi:hypothetical protein